MKTRKSRCDGVATRKAILEAATDEFCEKGYALGSVRAICARAGVNVALANRYFGSKDELYRATAKALFGDLGAPLAVLHETAKDAHSWKTAVRKWVSGFLFMTLPSEKAQRRCASLFRHEVTQPTRFHDEFRMAFGKPVHDGLRRLLTKATDDETELDLWTSSVWAQVSVYALADETWHQSFRPVGMTTEEWAARLERFICEGIFSRLRFRQTPRASF